MREREFLFYPYRIYGYLVIFTFFGGIFSFFVFLGYLMERVYPGAIVTGIMTVIYSILSKMLFDSSKIYICFGENGLQINNDKRCKYRYVSWESFSYAYWRISYTTHWYLVLSADVIEEKQLEHIIRKKDWSFNMGICHDDVIVINIACYRKEELAEIKKIIFEKILYIKDEKYKDVEDDNL